MSTHSVVKSQQGMIFGITPEFALRYLHIGGADYTNSLDMASEFNDTDYLTGVLGAKYAFNYTPSESVLIRPEIRAAVKYDFLSDAALSTDIISDILVYKTLTKNPPNGGFFARVHLL